MHHSKAIYLSMTHIPQVVAICHNKDPAVRSSGMIYNYDSSIAYQF